MNILPKKRWHVRTKENIARVRKDEAEAAEKEREEQLRIEKADREARLNVLKHKSKQKLLEYGLAEPNTEEPTPVEHVNLFTDLENAVKTTNKEHDKEFKDKKEEYEKKIGYLTYLGQDTNEALGKKNWYEVAPEARFSGSSEIKDTYDKLVLKDEDGNPKTKDLDIKDGEVCWKKKQMHDPINAFKDYLHRNKVDSKNKIHNDRREQKVNNDHFITTSKQKNLKKTHKGKNEEKDTPLKKLREQRLKREKQEKYRTELFLKNLNKPVTNIEPEKPTRVKPKYHSQFNPELARQNYR